MKVILAHPIFREPDWKRRALLADIPLEEILAIAIESYRQPDAYDFFKNTLTVIIMVEHRFDEGDFSNIVKTFISDVWKYLTPWLYSLYRPYSEMHHHVVHRLELREDETYMEVYPG